MHDLMLLGRVIVEERHREAAKRAWQWRLRETLIAAAARERACVPPRGRRSHAEMARAAVARCCGVAA